MSDTPKNNPDVVSELEQIAQQHLELAGLPADQVNALAASISASFRQRCGGLIVYVRKVSDAALEARNRKIFEECTGTNQERLARKYGLALAVIYRIVRRVGDIERAKHQVQLFEDDL